MKHPSKNFYFSKKKIPYLLHKHIGTKFGVRRKCSQPFVVETFSLYHRGKKEKKNILHGNTFTIKYFFLNMFNKNYVVRNVSKWCTRKKETKIININERCWTNHTFRHSDIEIWVWVSIKINLFFLLLSNERFVKMFLLIWNFRNENTGKVSKNYTNRQKAS